MQLGQLPLFEALSDADSILLAGAGGGFDIFAGLPLYFALRAMGKQVHLANLSFSQLWPTEPGWITPHLLEVTPDTKSNPAYFPEGYLSQHLSEKFSQRTPIYAFYKTGVAPLLAAYRALDQHLGGLDAVVLIDGGTDSLMRGDEPGLGSPIEDIASIAAVAQCTHIPLRLLVAIGFGVDSFHGVQHHYVLEAIAELSKQGAYLGAFSCLEQMPEVQAYQEALAFVHARMPDRPSIVNLSIESAVEGEFGDVQRTPRTQSSELYINPLMSLYFAFHLDAIAARCLYLDDYLRDTHTAHEVMFLIEGYRSTIAKKIRPKRTIPM